jgi:hypothetical protein
MSKILLVSPGLPGRVNMLTGGHSKFSRDLSLRHSGPLRGRTLKTQARQGFMKYWRKISMDFGAWEGVEANGHMSEPKGPLRAAGPNSSRARVLPDLCPTLPNTEAQHL